MYHVGKLFALLLHGSEKPRLTAQRVKVLTCSAWAKAIIQRCIGKRQRRFASAAEMLKALQSAPSGGPAKQSAVRSLQGKRVVFTGRLKMLRKKARMLLKRAGGISQAKVSHTTDILVVGEQSPHWKAEKKGQKLLDLDHEGERGHRIAMITEERFQNLVGQEAGSREDRPSLERKRGIAKMCWY